MNSLKSVNPAAQQLFIIAWFDRVVWQLIMSLKWDYLCKQGGCLKAVITVFTIIIIFVILISAIGGTKTHSSTESTMVVPTK